MAGLVLLIVLGTSVWVGFDAQGRDFSNHSIARGTFGWVGGCIALWIVNFPLYLVARARVPEKPRALASYGGMPASQFAPPIAPGRPSVQPPLAVADGGSKSCPECAEQVRAAARKCRFCGYRFEEDTP